jgi:glycosyltransferase involved in cell wall biosynthesis
VPTWFDHQVDVINRENLESVCKENDTLLFSWPPDAEFILSLPAKRKIVHMQGANTQGDIDLMTHADSFEFISHGLHMSQQLLKHNIIAPYVPSGIPDIFRYQKEDKISGSIAYMPRKGGDVIERLMEKLPAATQLLPIIEEPEAGVAAILKRADIFLAISANEALGLPPLEAMAANCCVVGYPGDGGFEFMRHGETAHVVANNDEQGLVPALQSILQQPEYRNFLREGGNRLATYYTLDREKTYLTNAIRS